MNEKADVVLQRDKLADIDPPDDIALSAEFIANLQELVVLEFNTIETYEAAVEGIASLDYRARLTKFLSHHEKYLLALCDAIVQEGGLPPEGGDYKEFLTKGPVLIAGVGGDKAILKALLLNELLTNKLYEKANQQVFPGYIQLTLKQALASVRHHRVWIESAIEQRSSSPES